MPIISGSTIIRGSKGTPIAQDDDDNLIAVMKGNYEGALKTWKVDADGRGEMFINDLTDDWGKKNIIGLAELASRLGAKQGYDNRGRQIWTDGAEAATVQWKVITAAGGAAGRSVLCAWRGAASVQLNTPANVLAFAGLEKDFYNPQTGRYSAEIAWSCDATPMAWFEIGMLVYDGTNLHICYVGADPTTGNYYYEDGAGLWVNTGQAIVQNADIHFWHKMKIVIDVNTLNKVRFLCDGVEHNIANVPLRTVLMGGGPMIRVTLVSYGTAAGARNTYLDDFIFSHLEP